MRITSVVFDFDGTLVDSNALKRNAWFEVFAGLNIAACQIESVLRQCPHADRFEIIDAVLTHLHSGNRNSAGEFAQLQAARIAEAYNLICEEGQASCPEIEGASSTLTILSRDRSLFLNSATPEEPLRRIVIRRNWAGFFSGVFGRPRSKVEILRKVAETSPGGIKGVAMVGDGLADEMAASDMGCVFFGVGDLRPSRGGVRVDHLADLPELLDRIDSEIYEDALLRDLR